MNYALVFHPSVASMVQQIPKAWLGQIEAALMTIARFPTRYAHPLQDPWEGYLAYDTEPYHLIYQIHEPEQLVVIAAITTVKW